MIEVLGQFPPRDWDQWSLPPQCWNPCSVCPYRCLFMIWVFLLITWIMTHSSYVTSVFLSIWVGSRKWLVGYICCWVVGFFLVVWLGFFFLGCFNVILLSDFYMTSFVVRLQLVLPLKGSILIFFFFNTFFSMHEKQRVFLLVCPFHLSYFIIHLSWFTCVSLFVGLVFFPPWILFFLMSVLFEAFLFTHFSHLFLSLIVISSLFSNQVL